MEGVMDYKEAYEKEHIKTADLAERVAVLEAQNEDLKFKLNRIKNIRRHFPKQNGECLCCLMEFM